MNCGKVTVSNLVPCHLNSCHHSAKFILYPSKNNKSKLENFKSEVTVILNEESKMQKNIYIYNIKWLLLQINRNADTTFVHSHDEMSVKKWTVRSCD